MTKRDPAEEQPAPDDAWRRRWRNTVGRTVRTPYVGEPAPDTIRLPPSVVGVAREPASPGDGFRAPEACAIAGITYRQLDYWARTGLLRPSLQDPRGSGTQRLYSFDDLVRLSVLKRLLEQGLSLQKARAALDLLEGDVSSAVLVVGPQSKVVPDDDAEALVGLAAHQGGVFLLPLAGVVAGVRKAIEQLAEGAVSASRPSAGGDVEQTSA